MQPGMYATKKIVERVEAFAKEHDKRVLYVLSFGAYTIGQFLKSGKRFDQAMVDFFRVRRLPVVDLMEAHASDAAKSSGDPSEALKRYFIGHYNPLGNHFCAFAIKDALVKLLDPKPPAYAR